MSFKSFGSVASGLIGDALETRNARKLHLVDFYTETVIALHDTALRQDPDTYKPLGRQFDTKAGVADHIILEAATRITDGDLLDEENALRGVCDEYMRSMDRPLPKVVEYERGDYGRCATLKF